MIHRPESAEAVAAIIQQTVASGGKLTARRNADGGAAVIDLSALAAVSDYPARDMTITVQAGMTYGTLTRILQQENQQLPVDCPDEDMSVGALVAADVCGSRQYGYGTLRDYVIGIEAVDGRGRVFHAGGRVVKNVAGYDLCRLLVGSRGALGVITQVTFKLKPIPEQQALTAYRFSTVDELDAALVRLNTSAATPVILDFQGFPQEDGLEAATPENDARWLLTIGVEGSAEVCRWQCERLHDDCRSGSEASADSYPVPWSAKEVVLRCLPSQLTAIAKQLVDNEYSPGGHAGSGVVRVASRDGSNDGVRELRSVCDHIAAAVPGTIVSEWDADHPGGRSDTLSTRLRQVFDPDSVFAL